MAAEADIIRYVITGEEGEVIPRHATHVSVHPTVRIIRRRLFLRHPNIVELICHDGVIKIEQSAFIRCPRLKRVIMNSVEEVERGAFQFCFAMEYIECEKIEIIGANAFYECRSITNINLPSAKIVRAFAFSGCPALMDAKFGNKLESIEGLVFFNCHSLQRITLPLKNDLFDDTNTFQCCENLRHVDLTEGAVLQQTIDTLLWEEWKNDMNAKVASIDQILPNAPAGILNAGEKAIEIRQWIRNVLRKITYYKSQHRRSLEEAACMLKLALPHDIVINNVVPFLILPQHAFDGEDDIDESDSGNESIDESFSSNVSSDEEEDYHSRSEGEEEEGYHDSSEGEDSETGEERQQEGVNSEERRKRQRTESNGDDVDGEEHD